MLWDFWFLTLERPIWSATTVSWTFGNPPRVRWMLGRQAFHRDWFWFWIFGNPPRVCLNNDWFWIFYSMVRSAGVVTNKSIVLVNSTGLSMWFDDFETFVISCIVIPIQVKWLSVSLLMCHLHFFRFSFLFLWWWNWVNFTRLLFQIDSVIFGTTLSLTHPKSILS